MRPVEIFIKGRHPFALAGLWTRYFEAGVTRYSFTVFTTEPNEFMRSIHPNAIPVVLTNLDKQELWVTEGDEQLLRAYEGIMEADQLTDPLEHLYADEPKADD